MRLFGAGLDRPTNGPGRAIIEAINAGNATIGAVIAVDVPSGINANSGGVMGAAVQATHTVTFFRRKPGHLLLPGRLHCGQLEVADIGIPDSVLAAIKPRNFTNEPALWRAKFPVPQVAGHKYSRGNAVVVSGPLPMTGAARLAARGALRAGAGLVTIASPHDALLTHAAENVAVMVRPVDGAKELSAFMTDRRLNAVVVGPGAGVSPGPREQVGSARQLCRGGLDADAISSFAGRGAELAGLIAGPPRPGHTDTSRGRIFEVI